MKISAILLLLAGALPCSLVQLVAGGGSETRLLSDGHPKLRHLSSGVSNEGQLSSPSAVETMTVHELRAEVVKMRRRVLQQEAAAVAAAAQGCQCPPPANAPAAPAGPPRTATITFKNNAAAQPLSPSIFVLHTSKFQLFTVGQPSSEGMALLAETGDPKPLATALMGREGVLATALSDAPVFPGNSSSITMNLPPDCQLGDLRFSFAGMLINTNDAYAGVCGFAISPERVMTKQTVTVKGETFDAGSEENNELCSSIPGPACPPDSGNVRSGNGEGTVTTPHPGVLGINVGRTDLSPKDLGVDGKPLDQRFTFTDPTTEVTIVFA